MNFYHLEKYSGRASRHTCPHCERKNCFTRYVDDANEPLSPLVGRCDHESSCGYHRTPREYFHDHPDIRDHQTYNFRFHRPRPEIKTVARIDCVPMTFVKTSEDLAESSNLIRFLERRLPINNLKETIKEYHIGGGSSGETIFFQIDRVGRCRSGKIIRYNLTDGHRIKDPRACIPVSWVHSILKKNGKLPDGWTLTQCLFGEHLLDKYPARTVALVESEKSAIICATVMPEYIWLATGGKSQLNSRLDVLKDRIVVAFPDADAYDSWSSALPAHPFAGLKISDIIERNATEEERLRKIDIADWIVEYGNGTFRL